MGQFLLWRIRQPFYYKVGKVCHKFQQVLKSETNLLQSAAIIIKYDITVFNEL